MKLNGTPRIRIFDPVLERELRNHATQVNLMAEGRLSAFYQANTAPPTTGNHAWGDFVLNSEPTELGSASSKYVIHGWRCDAGGNWLEMRFLTGN